MSPRRNRAAARIEEVVRGFAERGELPVTDPAWCRDRCWEVAAAFAEACVAAGLTAKVICGVLCGTVPGHPGTILVLQGHAATLLDDVVYDWTARQFDPSAAVPLVQPLAIWRERWRSLESLESVV